MAEQVRDAIAQLKPIQRERLIKYFFEGKSLLQIAAEEGKSYSTVYESYDRQSIQIPVWEKYALTVKEAAEYYNIAETKLRDYLLANRDAPFVLKGGARLLVKRKMFEMFLDESNII